MDGIIHVSENVQLSSGRTPVQGEGLPRIVGRPRDTPVLM